MESKYNYLAKNTIIFTISSFGAKILSFLLVPFYTSVLSQEDYGIADVITITSNLLIFIVTLCIADSVMRFAMDGESNRYGTFRYGLKTVFLGLAVLGVVLLGFTLINPFGINIYVYLFLYLIIFFNSLNQLFSNYLKAINCIGTVAIMGVVVVAFTIICNLVFLVVFKLGVIGYLISMVVGLFASTFYGFVAVLIYDRKCLFQKCNIETKKKMISYSLPLIFNGVAWWANSSFDRYFIIYNSGVSVNGLYAAASKIPTILSEVSVIFSQAWNISAIKEFNNENKETFYSNIYSLYHFVLVIGCSVLIVLNKPLAKLLFLKDFYEAWQYSSILVISAVFSALSGFLGGIFAAVKNSRIFAISTIIASFTNIILNYLLVPLYGATGAAAATTISFFIIWLIRYICSTKYLKLKINLFKDVFSYFLLVLQALFDHFDNLFYVLQIIIIIVLVLLNFSVLKKIFKYISMIVKKFITGQAL